MLEMMHERVIKLGQDYSNVLSKDSGTVREILHAVEEVRKRVPEYSKKYFCLGRLWEKAFSKPLQYFFLIAIVTIIAIFV